MAPKKSSKMRKPSKKLLEMLETIEEPPHSETESESLLTQRTTAVQVSQDSEPDPSEDTELYTQTQRTRSLPPTPKRKGKGKNTVPVQSTKAPTEDEGNEVARITPQMEEELKFF